MGINMKSAKDDFYYVDSILKRCIVLSVEQQNSLYDYLIYTVESYSKLQLRKNIPQSIEMEYIKTFWHNLDQIGQEEFKKSYGNFPQLSINQFRFPWVGLMKTNSTYQTKGIFSKNLQIELDKNLTQADKIKSHLGKVSSTIVQRNKYNSDFIYKTAIPLLKSLHLGLCITIEGNDGKIFGYVHNIEIPRVHDAHKYESLTLIHIKTINPHLHSSIHYSNEDYYINLEELIESDSIELNNKPINWNQFNRPAQTLVRSNYCFVGHPIYMQFLQQSYKIGEIEYFNFYNKKQMCVVLPCTMTEQELLKLKKPMYQANRIMQGLISKQINTLTSSWEDEDKVKAIFKLEPTTGGYNLFVAQEVSRNYDIIDFPLKKKLQDFRGNMNGYYLYFIPYKDTRGLLWMLEQRNVVWFVGKK
jgi:hypothetical protein